MRDIVLIAHNIRSSHNVGSLLRTADGLGVTMVYLTGYTPYPHHPVDTRLPHISRKIHTQISKTALGAEMSQAWQQQADVFELLKSLRQEGYTIAGLEQTDDSAALHTFRPGDKLAIVLGNEVEGLEPVVLAACDIALEITMFGRKESFNVVQAAAMALYHCRFYRS